MSSESTVNVREETWSGSDNAIAKAVARPMARFLRQEAASGVLLIIATVVALLWANFAAESYTEFWDLHLNIKVGDYKFLDKGFKLVVNDALMVIFFFVVGLEIKSELVTGDLSSPRVAALPAIAALGGMIVPAGLYLLLNAGTDGANGWGIPMATDIAFAVGVLALLGKRIPQKLKLFLLTLAIVDDIGAIAVIAIFYSKGLEMTWLAAAVGLLVVIVALRYLRVWYLPVYVILGAVVWYATFRSGVHATIAGVVLGLLTPAKPLLGERRFESVEDIFSGDTDITSVRELHFQAREQVPVTQRLTALLSPWSSFLIIPVFALANAGIRLTGDKISAASSSPVTWGIVLGLVVGKPLGVFLFTWVAAKSKIATLPDGVGWGHVLGGGAVAGIGFTVALFISELAFEPDKGASEAQVLITESLKTESIMGILLASILASILGAVILLASRSGDSTDTDTGETIEGDDGDLATLAEA